MKETKHKYFPKTRAELKELVDHLIEERGINADLNDIDTSKITDMSFIFRESNFNSNISRWNVSSVENTYNMFEGCPLEDNEPTWYKK